MDWQRLPKPRNISMKFFHPEYLMGWENRLKARTTRSFYYVIKARLNLNFATGTNIYTVKEHGKIFSLNNVVQMKKTIHYQRSRISNEDADLDRPKHDATRFVVDMGDMLGPDCAWLLVSSGHFFFHCNATSNLKVTVHPQTFIKLLNEWLKIQKKFQG